MGMWLGSSNGRSWIRAAFCIAAGSDAMMQSSADCVPSSAAQIPALTWFEDMPPVRLMSKHLWNRDADLGPALWSMCLNGGDGSNQDLLISGEMEVRLTAYQGMYCCSLIEARLKQWKQ